MAIPAVRLKMAAFGPFVPGVDEDEALLAREILCVLRIARTANTRSSPAFRSGRSPCRSWIAGPYCPRTGRRCGIRCSPGRSGAAGTSPRCLVVGAVAIERRVKVSWCARLAGPSCCGVETPPQRRSRKQMIPIAMGQRAGDMDFRNADLRAGGRQISPISWRSGRCWGDRQQQRRAVDADIRGSRRSGIRPLMNSTSSSGRYCCAIRISCSARVPASRPVLVRPAEAERQVGFGVGKMSSSGFSRSRFPENQ